jgi:hypothetical protein
MKPFANQIISIKIKLTLIKQSQNDLLLYDPLLNPINLRFMKTHLMICLQCLLVFTLFAQSREELIPMESSELLSHIDLQENGFVLFTGDYKLNSKNQDWKIHKFDAEMNKVFEVAVEKTQINKGFTNYLVGDMAGKYIYLIEPRGYNTTFGVSSININQIDEKGSLKTMMVEEAKKKFKYNKVVTCTDNYMLYIQTQTNNIWKHKKRADEIVTFQRFNHSNLSYTSVTANLPAPRLSKNSSYWTYIGTDGKELYFAQEEVDDEKKTMVADIAVLSEDGARLRSFTINVALEDEHFLRPSYYARASNELWFKFPDFYYNASTSSTTGYATGTTTTTTTYTPKPYVNAFVNIQYDPISDAIYVFGLYGPKAFESSGSKYEGYYFMKYDKSGKQIWKMEENVPEALSKSKYFRVDAAPESRVVSLRCEKDKVRLYLTAKKTGMAMEFDGKIGSAVSNVVEFKKPLESGMVQIVSPIEETSALRYQADLLANRKKVEPFMFFYSSKGEVLVEFRKKELGLLFFK